MKGTNRSAEYFVFGQKRKFPLIGADSVGTVSYVERLKIGKKSSPFVNRVQFNGDS